MTYTHEQLDAIRAENDRCHLAIIDLKNALRKVLNSTEHKGLCNCTKGEILLDLENGGEYDPLG